MENLAFHSLLRWKMITLPTLNTSLIHFSSKGLENVLFYLGSESPSTRLVEVAIAKYPDGLNGKNNLISHQVPGAHGRKDVTSPQYECPIAREVTFFRKRSYPSWCHGYDTYKMSHFPLAPKNANTVSATVRQQFSVFGKLLTGSFLRILLQYSAARAVDIPLSTP